MYNDDDYKQEMYHSELHQTEKKSDSSTTEAPHNDYYTMRRSQGYHIPEEPKKKRPKLWKKFAVGMGLAVLFGGFAGLSFFAVREVGDYFDTTNKVVSEVAVIPEESASIESDIEPENGQVINAVVTDVTDVVSAVMPSLVSITNIATITQQDVFGQTYVQEGQSSGSGIIVGENDTELLIVSNNHVVADSRELKVQFIDGTEAVAQVKGIDASVDLAVIAIPLENLSEETRNSISIAELGDSEHLSLGEPTIAIGNALGYGQSVTTGVVSALNREVIVDDVEYTLIQTDAAINFGNSGGALLNVKGQVVGINSTKVGGTAIEGMGYAIPISTAKPIIEELMTKTTRMKVAEESSGYLGIMGQNVTQEVAQVYNLPKGVCITQVVEGQAAEKAGLVRGDIITKIDGSTILSMEDLKSRLTYYQAGETVEISIMQGSPMGYQEKSVSVTLSQRPLQ